MIIKPMLGELEVPGLQRIGADQKRRIVDVAVPGLAGGLSQDLGAESIKIVIEGSLAGDEARDGFLDSVREMFDAGDPVDFVADIATATEVFQVLVEDLKVNEIAGTANPFQYRLVLRQYVEPPEPISGFGLGDGFPGVDDLGLDMGLDLDLEAGDLFDMLEIPDLLGAPNISDPTQPLTSSLDGLASSLEGLSGISESLSSLFGEGG